MLQPFKSGEIKVNSILGMQVRIVVDGKATVIGRIESYEFIEDESEERVMQIGIDGIENSKVSKMFNDVGTSFLR